MNSFFPGFSFLSLMVPYDVLKHSSGCYLFFGVGDMMFFKHKAFADTFALITFGLIVGMSVELLVAGLTLEQSLHSRMLSVPINILIATPYGMYRDWLMGFRFPGRDSIFGSAALDIIAFITFQMPIYALTVASSGASMEHVVAACMGQMGALIIMGRPYGIWMQLCRNWFVPGTIPAT